MRITNCLMTPTGPVRGNQLQQRMEADLPMAVIRDCSLIEPLHHGGRGEPRRKWYHRGRDDD